jgi:hypothetical protein
VPAGWTLRYRRSREQPSSVGDGSTLNNTQPYAFFVTDGAQDNQVKGVPNSGWSGSNHATVIDPTTVRKPLKDRGIIISWRKGKQIAPFQ